MKLSIVIPVYNVEDFVEKCILSCIQQQVAPSLYEIIIINDGSVDGSVEIVSKLVNSYQYVNIKLYEQENRGLSATRNRGIDLALGSYIWFVDSDDYISQEALGCIFPLLDEQIDIFHFNTSIEYLKNKSSKIVYRYNVPNKAMISGVNILAKKKNISILWSAFLYISS